jgi:hypothetical protein
VKLVPADDLVGLENKIQGMIAVRAHELFERRGCLLGHDVDDWIQAESNLSIFADMRWMNQKQQSFCELCCRIRSHLNS